MTGVCLDKSLFAKTCRDDDAVIAKKVTVLNRHLITMEMIRFLSFFAGQPLMMKGITCRNVASFCIAVRGPFGDKPFVAKAWMIVSSTEFVEWPWYHRKTVYSECLL
ncbi:hypothetical protein ElyMa_000076900 [Elysia marginata]|uniref:Uncharacterized protein n=1 Tax=Elysia marginata TaxID=1093978 RepID=A0AAV4EIN9_9GAST|nr:hypothetical protein ElyMa_000076900 [Elysia marginata]